MAREIKTLDDILNEKANQPPQPQKKETSFLGRVKERQELKAAAKRARQERIERERPVRVSLSKIDLTEANIIKIIKEKKSEHPIEFVIDIGSYKQHIGDGNIYNSEISYFQFYKDDIKLEQEKIRTSNSATYAFLENFDKKHGTCHKINIDTSRKREEEKRYASAKYDYEEYTMVRVYEIGKIYAILYVSIEKIEEIMQKLTIK